MERKVIPVPSNAGSTLDLAVIIMWGASGRLTMAAGLRGSKDSGGLPAEAMVGTVIFPKGSRPRPSAGADHMQRSPWLKTAS